MMLKHRAWAARLILLVVAIVVGGLVAELAVRTRQYVKYGTFFAIGGFRRVDATTGLETPAPGSSTARIRINSLGFRSPELSQPKPKSRLRLAFVGGSTTFCAEVSGNEWTWPHLVMQQLKERYPDVDMDYVNAGIPGITTASSVVNLERRVRPLEPDVIVLYEGFNDLLVEITKVARNQGLHARRTDQGLARWSLGWDLLTKNMQIAVARRRSKSGRQPLVVDRTNVSRGFGRTLSEIIDRSQQIAPVVAVATLSYRMRRDQSAEEQLAAAEAALFYLPFLSPAGMIDIYDRYNETIRQVSESERVVLIGQEDSIPGDAAHFHDTIHLADAGAELMMRRVIAALTRSDRFHHLIETHRGSGGRQASLQVGSY